MVDLANSAIWGWGWGGRHVEVFRWWCWVWLTLRVTYLLSGLLNGGRGLAVFFGARRRNNPHALLAALVFRLAKGPGAVTLGHIDPVLVYVCTFFARP